MRRSPILAAALALAGATHASAAGDVSHNVTMTADVPSLCSFSEVGGDGLETVSEASSTFLVPIDAALSKVAADQAATLTFAVASCNAISTVKLERNGFRHVDHASHSGLPAGVSNQIEYIADVSWAGGPLVELTPGINEDEDPNVSPRNAPLTLTIMVPQGAQSLVAGAYTDTLTLTVNPN